MEGEDLNGGEDGLTLLEARYLCEPESLPFFSTSVCTSRKIDRISTGRVKKVTKEGG
jgi:hypothetical protein